MLNESITTIYRRCESAIRDHVNSLYSVCSLRLLLGLTELEVKGIHFK